MSDPTPLEQTIEDAAKAPRRAQGDNGSMEQQPLADLIEADRYLAAKKAMKSKQKGLQFSKLVPPGAA